MHEFVNRLRRAASSCKFGTLTDELIRDRNEIGLQDKATKLRILKEENLDFIFYRMDKYDMSFYFMS